MKTVTIKQLIHNGLKPIPWVQFDRFFVKIEQTKTPGMVKVISRERISSRPRPKRSLEEVLNGPVTAISPDLTIVRYKTMVSFVRDGFIVKNKTRNHAYILGVLGAKSSIRSKNLGALFKKYEVPKSLRIKFLALEQDIHSACLCLEQIRKFLSCVEDQVAFFNSGSLYRFHPKRVNKITPFLLQVPKSKLLSYMVCDHLFDIVRMTKKLQENNIPIDLNTKPEIYHDWAAKEYNKILYPNKQVEYTTKENDFVVDVNNKLSETNLTVKFAESTYELVEWGGLLKHCVGTYGHMAVDKTCFILGVYVEGVLTYTIELNTSFSVRQFYGYRNSRPTIEHDQAIRKAITESVTTPAYS